MNEHGGTVTAPIYGDIVIAILVVLAAMTIIAITQAVVQKVRAAGAKVDLILTNGLAEIDLAHWDDCWGGGPGQWIGSAS